ncbi:MAG: hypothetical protein LH618_10860 [Saprospiraceae bacterium]|nr:hypothetical protein [Saprospiraceae bacterium]
MLQFLATEGQSADPNRRSTRLPEPADDQLLDAYSQTVTRVARRVSDAVVHLKVQKPAVNPQNVQQNRQQPDPSGTGSGFVISSD